MDCCKTGFSFHNGRNTGQTNIPQALHLGLLGLIQLQWLSAYQYQTTNVPQHFSKSETIFEKNQGRIIYVKFRMSIQSSFEEKNWYCAAMCTVSTEKSQRPGLSSLFLGGRPSNLQSTKSTCTSALLFILSRFPYPTQHYDKVYWG